MDIGQNQGHWKSLRTASREEGLCLLRASHNLYLLPTVWTSRKPAGQKIFVILSLGNSLLGSKQDKESPRMRVWGKWRIIDGAPLLVSDALLIFLPNFIFLIKSLRWSFRMDSTNKEWLTLACRMRWKPLPNTHF